jgi:hypothetical protein
MAKTLVAALAAFGLAYAGVAPAFAFPADQLGETGVSSSVNHGGADTNTSAYQSQADRG